MDRRNFLKIGAAGLTGAMLPFANFCSDTPVYSGWNPDIKGIKRFVSHTGIKNLDQRTSSSFAGNGKTALLFKYLEQELGTPLVPHHQVIGDCVGQGYGLSLDVLRATQIHGLGRTEEFKVKASIEAIYAGSRYEIGYLKHGNSRLLIGDGSWGGYAVEFINQYGMLPRGIYGDVDLTEYNYRIARLWGRIGVPDSLEPQIKRHPIRSYALVKSYKNVRDAIVNGFPVIFCSSVGFNPSCLRHNPGGRDSMGFLQRCGVWYHCLAAIAVDDGERPGVLLANSWGPDWLQGGTRHGQPLGSFWVDARTISTMCSEGDSYAISNFVGFPSQILDYSIL